MKQILSIAVAIMIGTGILFAQPDQKCKSMTTVPAAPEGVKQIIVDANTGKMVNGASKHNEGAKIRIVFVNKNPYKYTYGFVQDIRSLDSGIALDFLKLIPGFAEMLPALEAGTPRSLACPQAATQADAVATKEAALKAALTALATDLKARDEVAAANRKFYEATDGEALGSAEQVCVQSHTLLPALQTLTDLKALNEKLEAAQKALKEYEEAVSAFNAAAGANCVPAQNSLNGDLASYRKKVTDSATAVKLLTDNKKAVEDMAKVIKAVHDSSIAFVEPMDVIEVDEPSQIQYTINRRNLREANGQSHAIPGPRITIGRPSLFLSGGIGFSTVPDQKISRVSSTNDKGEVKNRFGYETNSHFKPSALVMLNAPFWRFSWGVSVGLGVGLVISGREDNTQVEYMAGPAFGFLKDRVFFNATFHAAKVPKLAGGFRLNDLVPDNLPDPLPIEKNFRGGLFLAITFRIR